jgi:hypothetical protein
MKWLGSLGLCGALALLLLTAGCSSSDSAAAPPTPAQEQQRINALMDDPHVPDAVKQHLKDQAQANQQAARGRTAEMQRKQAGSK